MRSLDNSGTKWAYGYRTYNHTQVREKVHEVVESLKIKKIYNIQDEMSVFKPVMKSLGFHYKNHTLPTPDADLVSMAGGLGRRVARKMPKRSYRYMRRLKSHVKLWCKHNLTKLPKDADSSFETWLTQVPYSEKRKSELRQVYEDTADFGRIDDGNLNMPDQLIHSLKCFKKDESYTDYKHPRGIFSRKDPVKCILGPIFKLISDVLFHYEPKDGTLNPFIKTIPVPDRPMAIKEHLNGLAREFLVTDYTSYEAHFDKELIEAIEMVLYKYLLSNFSRERREAYIGIIRQTICNVNRLCFKNFMAEVDCKRMSGEMNTSLGNGFANFMIMDFLVYENARKHGLTRDDYKLRIVVEGDDGLATIYPPYLKPTTQQFEDVGTVIKLEIFDRLNHASFCGLLFDFDDEIVVTNPLEVLVRTPWVHKKYVNCGRKLLDGLARARGMSIAYQYAGSPILQSYGAWILRHTRHVANKDVMRAVQMHNLYDQEILYQALSNREQSLFKNIPAGTRQLVFDLYGIPIPKQIEIENWFDSSQRLGPVQFDLELPEVWQQYDSLYCSFTRDEGLAPGCVNHITAARAEIKFLIDRHSGYMKMRDLY